MEQNSPYQLFFNWLFDGQKTSAIPRPEILLKYNSPINEMFLLKMFIQVGRLNYLLNDYNHIGIYYLDREELFYFIKQCVRDFKVKRRDIHYFPRQKREILAEKLKEKLPLIKDHEISILAAAVEKSDDKERIYSSLGIDKPKKTRSKKSKGKSKSEKTDLKSFLNNNFEIMTTSG